MDDMLGHGPNAEIVILAVLLALARNVKEQQK